MYLGSLPDNGLFPAHSNCFAYILVQGLAHGCKRANRRRCAACEYCCYLKPPDAAVSCILSPRKLQDSRKERWHRSVTRKLSNLHPAVSTPEAALGISSIQQQTGSNTFPKQKGRFLPRRNDSTLAEIRHMCVSSRRSSAPVLTGSRAHPAPYTKGIVSFPGVKRPRRDVNQPLSSNG